MTTSYNFKNVNNIIYKPLFLIYFYNLKSLGCIKKKYNSSCFFIGIFEYQRSMSLKISVMSMHSPCHHTLQKYFKI